MEYMFWYAYQIKQNLCAWRLKHFPFDKCSGIFGGSGCQYKETPQDGSSSFCNSQCSSAILDSEDKISVKSASMCDTLVDHMGVDVEVCLDNIIFMHKHYSLLTFAISLHDC